MKRREFITLLGGAAAWPLAARAQQDERMRRIGLLTGGPRPDDQDAQANIAAFLEGLQRLGWIDGRNVRIDYRWALGQADAIHKQAAELAALAPDVILSSGTASLAPLIQATPTVPIVFVNVADPVGGGFVDSLARPGGNATGFMQFEYDLSGKWLELLKQIAPNGTRAAGFPAPALPPGGGPVPGFQSGGPAAKVGGGAGGVRRAPGSEAPHPGLARP